ncbi:MAG: hypothetical protein E7292_00505 [Lachnospiraceae bacterium]|nr:hypothetical protein [Lachnospiraceae bacterium]
MSKKRKSGKHSEIKVQEKKIYTNLDFCIFAVLFMGVVAVTFTLFHRQCVESMLGSGLYHSDMKAYILEMQGLDSGYSFPYPVLFMLSAFWDLFVSPEMAVAIATTMFNALALLITKAALNRFTLKELTKGLKGNQVLAGAIISVVAVGLFFVSMVFTSPMKVYLPGINYNYLGVFTANPFHNATYMAARPFAILAFLWYVKLLDSYEKKDAAAKYKGDYILFSLFLLISTMTKPSFTIVLVGAAGLIMVYRLFASKFRNFKPTILLGLTFIPTFIDLLYQFKGVFVPEEGVEGGIGFCFGDIWGMYCGNIPFAIGLAIGFPLVVLICNWEKIKTNTLYRFSWQIYLMSFAMAFLIYEKGFRAPDFNFSWGYMYGIFFAFVGAVVVLLRATAEKKRPLLLSLQWAAFGLHLLCGLYYFYGIFQGRMYY